MYHVTDGSKCEVGCFLSSTLTLLLLFSLAGSLLYTFAAAAAERKPARAVDWFWAERTPSDDSLLQMREHSGRRRSAWASYFKLAAANNRAAMQSGEMIKKKHKHHLLLMQSDGEMQFRVNIELYNLWLGFSAFSSIDRKRALLQGCLKRLIKWTKLETLKNLQYKYNLFSVNAQNVFRYK